MPIGNTFSFEPHGLKFNRVVSISFTYRDEDVPVGAAEGDVVVFVSDSPSGTFYAESGAACDIEGVQDQVAGCIETEVLAQFGDEDKNIAGVFVEHFSLRTLYNAISKEIVGCDGISGARPTLGKLDAEGFRLPILQCARPNITEMRPLDDITRIVVHSTAGSRVTGTFSGMVNNCALEPYLAGPPTRGCKGVAHYYISREGVIVQVVEDEKKAAHVLPDLNTTITNTNSIGIELFNNVGEPYDGRQITALVRLVDMLVRLHPTITRPSYPRDIATTSLFSHGEIQANRKDPTGLFRIPNKVVFFDLDKTICVEANVSMGSFCTRVLEDVSKDAVTLFDAVVAGVSAMGGDFKGLVNTQGGDAMGLAQAGAGGDITYKGREAMPVGTSHTDNLPLIVGPGETVVLPTTADYTDVLVSPGRLMVLCTMLGHQGQEDF
jgi:hypothetical protein